MNTYDIIKYSTGFDDNTINIAISTDHKDDKLTLHIDFDTPISSSMNFITLPKTEIRKLGEALIKAASDE